MQEFFQDLGILTHDLHEICAGSTLAQCKTQIILKQN